MHCQGRAKAAFRKGNPLLTLREELGTIFSDKDFIDLFPKLGQPGLPPWRLAFVTILQFRETLSDRQAAAASRRACSASASVNAMGMSLPVCTPREPPGKAPGAQPGKGRSRAGW